MFDMVIQLCMNNGFTPRILEHTNDLLATIMMAQIGMGLVILPGHFENYIPADMKFIPLDDENAYHEIGVVSNRQNPNPAVRLFLKELGL